MLGHGSELPRRHENPAGVVPRVLRAFVRSRLWRVHEVRLAGFGLALLLIGGCELGGGGEFLVMPGPGVPSPLPANAPYVWDTREELDIWVHNPVTRRPVPISLVGDGREAVIRIEPKRGLDGWVLRGPDFATPARRPTIRPEKA